MLRFVFNSMGSTTNIDDRAKEAWKQNTTGQERVRSVLEDTTEWKKASEISDEALVSVNTARKYLSEYVDFGLAETDESGTATTYRRNEGHFVDEQIRFLREKYTASELEQSIQEMKQELMELREKYDAESPEELIVELESVDGRWSDVSAWKTTEKNLAFAQAALQVNRAHRMAEA